jgi:hypothetical protein
MTATAHPIAHAFFSFRSAGVGLVVVLCCALTASAQTSSPAPVTARLGFSDGPSQEQQTAHNTIPVQPAPAASVADEPAVRVVNREELAAAENAGLQQTSCSSCRSLPPPVYNGFGPGPVP